MSETALGIIAGGGELPLAIADASVAAGRKVFVVGIEGLVQADDLKPYAHGFAALGEVGKAIRLLKEAGCGEVTLAGRVSRPNWSGLKLDARGALALPSVISAAMKGDDALLRTMVGIFEKEGLRVIGSGEAARELLAPIGVFGAIKPSEDDHEDIALGLKVVRAMGALDIGQAASVCKGLVLAVEAAEGTDAMLSRIAMLPQALRGTAGERRGVLVKAPKPNQERRVDLPVIGVATVELVMNAGLAGIAVEAGATLIMNKRAMVEKANRHGVFLFGFEPNAYSNGTAQK
jgi:DUF1009 family protein